MIPNAGHFPHRDHPQRFVKVLNEFIRSTQPASYSGGRWRTLLESGAPRPADQAEAGDAPVSPVHELGGAGA